MSSKSSSKSGSKSMSVSRNQFGVLIAHARRFLIPSGRVRKIYEHDIKQVVYQAVKETYKVSGKDANVIVVTKAFDVPNCYKYSAGSDICQCVAKYDDAFHRWNLSLETKRGRAGHRSYGGNVFSVKKFFDLNVRAAAIVLG